MRSAIVVLLLIPALCLGAQDLILSSNPEIQSQAVVQSSNQTATSINFTLNNLSLEPIMLAGEQYTTIAPPEISGAVTGQLAEEGYPDLPCYSNLVIIPDQANVQVNIISSDYQTIDNVDMAPVQPPTPESGAPEEIPFTKNMIAYSTDEFYPREIVHVGQPMIMRDFRFVQAAVQPVQYNPVTRQLRVYTNVSYELVYSGTDNRNILTRTDNNISEAFVPLYREFFANAELLLASYNPTRGSYLIIYPNNVQFPADTINLLADWKRQKGYYVKVTRTDQIPRIGTNPTNLEVKSYIQTAYDTWGIRRPDYVCLFGDVDVTNPVPNYPYSSYTSDHQYSQVAGGTADYLPDIFVMRMSVDNITELACLVHKTIYYEKTPYVGSDQAYWKRGLVVAGNISATTPRLTVLGVREQMLNNGYTQVDSVFDWGGGAPNAATIGTAMDNGISIVAYRGWAGASGWYNPHYYVADLSARTAGSKPGIMTSIVCGTGAYGSGTDPCFGEQWIRGGSAAGDTSYKGGPCFFGSTDAGTHTRWNNPIMVGFYHALFDNGVYHFGQNMVAGKLRMYETFPTLNDSGSMVNQYFNTYNALGDPELEIRTTIPKPMTASYLSSIAVGTNFLSFHVTDHLGAVLPGAYVSLYRALASDTIQIGGLTNNSGDITLNFRNVFSGPINVTVGYRNRIPAVGVCNVNSQLVTLGADTTIIDDDNSGGTIGNSDGKINPHETIGLNIRLYNFGTSTTATGISAALTSLDARVTVNTSSQTYSNIAPGGNALPAGQYIVTLANNIPHNEILPLQLAITSSQGTWQTQVLLTNNSILVGDTVTISYPGNGNGILDPGETSNMAITWKNTGGLAAQSVTGVLSSTDPYITILDPNGTFGNVAINGTGNNSADPFQVSLRDSAFDGRMITFTVSFTANNATIGTVQFQKSFTTSIGTINTTDPTGPDAYGYYAYDNTDSTYAHHPTYSWLEINPSLGGTGQRITFPNNDDASVLFTLPYTVQYYGQNYGHMIICINGFAAFDTVPYDVAGNYWFNWSNWPIPDPGNARAQISPFWDDLKITGSNNGVYTYYDSENSRLIVEWSDLPHANTGAIETFQMIISRYDVCGNSTPTGDAEITFQYKNIVNNDYVPDPYSDPETYSSVGIENWSESIGLQYEYNNIYPGNAAPLAAGRAIKFTTAHSRFNANLPSESHAPTNITLQCPPGGQNSSQVIIHNSGDCNLSYTLSPEMISYRRSINNPLTPNNDNSASQPIVNSPNIPKDEKTEITNPPMTLGHGGPDVFGHMWIDSDEAGGPTYSWVDISGVGTPITLADDNNSGPYTIGFNFPFYQNTYSSVYINSNGVVGFTSLVAGSNGTNLPNTGTPNDIIALWWDDMDPPHQGNVYYYADAANHRFIVSYVNIGFYYGTGATGSLTMQAILYEDGNIVFQYGTMTPGSYSTGLNGGTIGIENSDASIGLQVVYNAAYLHSNMAIAFTVPPPPPTTLTLTPSGGIIHPGASDTVAVIAHADSAAAGQYQWRIDAQTSDPNAGHSSYNIPVTINVGTSPTGHIKGIVKENNNVTPIPNVIVTTYGPGHVLVATDTTNGSGQYVLTLATGTYSEEFRKVTYRDTSLSSVTIVTNDTTRITMLMNHKPGYLEGTVKKQDNTTVIQGAIVRAYNAGDTLKGTDTTDSAGKFLLPLSAGTFHEIFTKAGYVDSTLSGSVINWAETTHVTMLLREAPPQCAYMQGDLNSDDQRLGGDVTFGVRFFKGLGSAPPDSCYMDSTGTYLYVAGDVNGNCEFRGSDITRLVAYFKGTSSISYCHFFPPPILRTPILVIPDNKVLNSSNNE
jgi:hypothetical protein